ncbi:MAG: DNA primase [Bacilli bacterium]|nr:DNA primase [Bacilli bacterium]
MNNDLANTIRNKVDIVDIIGERLPLVKKGKNYWGVCPFHDDNNPSMSVSRDKQIYKCFSCGAAGNVFTFLMNYDHMDFREALTYLGNKCGVDVGKVKIVKKNTKFDKLYDAYDLSNKYYQNNLNSTSGKLARDYLSKRKIDNSLIKEFGIGLSLSDRDDLTKLLTNKKYSLDDLNDIGLSNEDHDMYVDRVMFPLSDVNGKVVGFSGRKYRDGDDTSKYVNTKESPIFKKGEMLYHYSEAREEARLNKSIIVMEGFMDVIRASSIGVKNTVALMGTALTDEQIKLIKRLSSNIILCLDGDEPGVHATIKNGDLFLKEGIEVKVLPLPDPDDPDTFILNNSKDKFLNLLENALNFSDFKITKMKEKVNFNSIEEKSNYINAVIEETAKIDDDIRVEIILKGLAKEFDIGYNTLESRLLEYKEKKPVISTKTYKEVPSTNKKDKYVKAIEQIFYLMLNNDWVITEVENARLIFPNEKYRVLSAEIIYYYHNYGNISIADFYTYIQDKEDVLEVLNEVLAGNYVDKVDKEELDNYFKVIKSYSIKKEIELLTKKIKEEYDPIEQAKIAEKIINLRKEESI